MNVNLESKFIKNKLGLLKLSETLGSVSKACKVMGISRDSFYRFRELYEQGGEAAKAAQDGLILTETHVNALEKAREEKQAHGEIESEPPGYLGSQDTYGACPRKGGDR